MQLDCWNKDCRYVFNLECGPSDQTLVCGSCEEVGAFVNLGYFICTRCRRKCKIALSNINRIIDIRCSACKTLYVGTGNFRIYTLQMVVEEEGQHFGLNYCGNYYFESMEGDARKGKEMIDHILARGKWKMLFGKKVQSEKNIMFIHRAGPMHYPGKKIPVDYLQTYHATCNYNVRTGHQNAKLTGVLSQFADSCTFDHMTKPGINEIWFGDSRTRSEFEILPQLRKYHNIFKTV